MVVAAPPELRLEATPVSAPPVPQIPKSLPAPPAMTDPRGGADNVHWINPIANSGGVGYDGQSTSLDKHEPGQMAILAADGDGAASALQDHLTEAQRVLARSHAQAAGLVAECQRAVQAEADGLRAENCKLRALAVRLTAAQDGKAIAPGLGEPEPILPGTPDRQVEQLAPPTRRTSNAWGGNESIRELVVEAAVRDADAQPGVSDGDTVVHFLKPAVDVRCQSVTSASESLEPIADSWPAPLRRSSHRAPIGHNDSKRQESGFRSRASGFEFVPLDIWIQQEKKSAFVKVRTGFVTLEDLHTYRSSMFDAQEVTTIAPTGGERFWIVHPSATSRTIWDFVSLALVLYDMLFVPMMLFSLPNNYFFRAVAWITRIFWTLDIPATITTGYITSNGSIELRPWMIWRHYYQSWFTLDIFVVAVDWMELVVGEDFLRASGFGKASRIIRVVRLARLLRLVRMREVISSITEHVSSERMLVILDIVKITVAILGMAHVIGCIWYCISDLSDGDGRWVVEYEFVDEAVAAQYLMSLHWSLSQFAGGMDEITAMNIPERIFAIMVFVIAFLVASAFVSSLTSSMTQLYIISSSSTQQLSVLRRYLSQNGISQRLSMRVVRNAQHALQESKDFMQEDGVEILEIVSDPLRMEVHFEQYRDFLSVHPFFKSYVDKCPQVMRRVCHLAVAYCMYSAGDVIFNLGENPSQPQMYFVVRGTLQYVSHCGEVTDIGAGQWVAEASLWTRWIHMGVLTATSDCRLCRLDSLAFQDIVGHFEHVDFCPAQYAREFLYHLNHTDVEISDLWFKLPEDTSEQTRSKFAERAKTRASSIMNVAAAKRPFGSRLSFSKT